MSEFKGTPGPWEAIGRTVSAENGSVFCIADCYAPHIGPMWSGTDYTGIDCQLANVRLIAAAPELLEALLWVKNQGWLRYTKRLPNQNAFFCDGVDKALAAIAKATGA